MAHEEVAHLSLGLPRMKQRTRHIAPILILTTICSATNLATAAELPIEDLPEDPGMSVPTILDEAPTPTADPTAEDESQPEDAVGGIVGSVGGSLAGMYLLGFAFGPLGWIVGGLIGGATGGWFGGQAPGDRPPWPGSPPPYSPHPWPQGEQGVEG